MTEIEAYQILCKPYVKTAEVAQILECDSKTASWHLKNRKVARIYKGSYITADFIDKFNLTDYWSQVSRFADTQKRKV